jgi:pyridoxal phosphate-dependent aminotransferase EpsN
VFIDCDAATWNLDPALLAEELAECALRGRLPKAAIVVDLYGQSADHEPILAACAAHGVPVVEDAAEALGASYRGASVGRFGRCGVFSFNGNKVITTSGGGMLVSDDAELVRRARYLATQARDPAPHYQHSAIGYNYRLSNVLAAIGRGQLRVLAERVTARRRNFEYYRERLADLPGIQFMPEAPFGRCSRWLTCLTVDPARFGATRDDIRLALEAQDIEARPVWKPMHLQPVFGACRVRGGAVAARLFDQGLCLPSGSSLTDDDLERIVGIVRGVHRDGGRSRPRSEAP